MSFNPMTASSSSLRYTEADTPSMRLRSEPSTTPWRVRLFHNSKFHRMCPLYAKNPLDAEPLSDLGKTNPVQRDTTCSAGDLKRWETGLSWQLADWSDAANTSARDWRDHACLISARISPHSTAHRALSYLAFLCITRKASPIANTVSLHFVVFARSASKDSLLARASEQTSHW